MGIDAGAHLGYGFKITGEKLVHQISEETDLPKGFDLIYGFDGDDDSEPELFVCTKASVLDHYQWDDQKLPIKPTHFEVQSQWIEDLLKLAKELNIKKPKIGWWLVATLS